MADAVSLTNAEYERLIDAFLAKAKRGGEPGYGVTFDEWLWGLVGTVVVDTSLVLEGKLRIEDYED